MGGAGDLRNFLSLCGQADVPLEEPAIARMLGGLHVLREDVDEWTSFSEVGYQRVVIHRTPRFEVLLLCWRSGQRSAIHDHAGSTCGIRIIAGTATETIYAASPCGRLYPVRSRCLETGSVCVNHDADIHQMANLAPTGQDLITLHIYSPPLAATRIYSIRETILADHDCLAVLRPRDLARLIRVDGPHASSSSTPRRASKVTRGTIS
jgi:cysteine dioxygenase